MPKGSPEKTSPAWFGTTRLYVYTSLGVHLRTLPPAFAERCRVFAELWWGWRNLCGVCRTPRGVSRTRWQNPVWGSVNPLGFGCLRLTFCGFDKLPPTLGGVLTDRCTHTIPHHLEAAIDQGMVDEISALGLRHVCCLRSYAEFFAEQNKFAAPGSFRNKGRNYLD